MRSQPHSHGFSTLEIMIALMIVTTTLAAVVLVALGIPSALVDGHEQEIGMNMANALLQEQFLFGLNSFSSIVSVATTTSIDSGTTYGVSLSVNLSPDGLIKDLVSSATWTDAKGRVEYASISGVITDFADARPQACSSVLEGDWTHPFVKTFSFPYPIQALAVSSSTLLAGIPSASSQSDPTLLVFDISSSTNPTHLGSMDNATSTRTGFAALAAQDNLAYGANAYASNFATCTTGSACSQLQIIDLTNPANPTMIENFQLSTTSAPFAIGSGGQSAGRSISYANGFIYLGLQKVASSSNNGQSDEFNIINVQNPRAPIWLGGYAVGRSVNQIQVANGFAYLATDDPARELIILDVHDPTNITLAGSYDAPGNTAFGFGEALSIASTTLALGRSYIQNEPQFSLLNISSPITLSLSSVLGSEPVNSSPNSIENLLIRGSLVFVLTNSSVEFWNISNLANPTSYAPPITLPGVGSITSNSSLACKDNTLYVASTDATHAGYLTVITGS